MTYYNSVRYLFIVITIISAAQLNGMSKIVSHVRQPQLQRIFSTPLLQKRLLQTTFTTFKANHNHRKNHSHENDYRYQSQNNSQSNFSRAKLIFKSMPPALYLTGLHHKKNEEGKEHEENDEEVRKKYFETYGRNITLIIDEYDSPYPYDSLVFDLFRILQDNSTIAITNECVWQKVSNFREINENFLTSWDTFKNNDGVLIFIPKILKAQSRKINTYLGIDLSDFQLISHIPKITLFQRATTSMNALLAHATLNAFKNFTLHKTKDDLADKHPWLLFLYGHGGIDGTTHHITGWPAYHFNHFLNHVNANLSVKCLLYLTCYSGSKRVFIDTFADQKFNFPIISIGWHDVTLKSEEYSNTEKNKFNDFFQLLNSTNISTEQKSIDTISKAIFSIIPQNIDTVYCIRNKAESIFALVEQKNILSSNKTTKVQDPAMDLTYLFLKPMHDETITLNSKTCNLSSALPGQLNHYIKELNMSSCQAPEDLFKAFMEIQSKDRRIYLIERLNGNNGVSASNIIIFHNVAKTFSPQISENFYHNYFMYYEQNGKPHIVTLENGFSQYKNEDEKYIRTRQKLCRQSIGTYEAHDYKNLFIKTREYLQKNPEYKSEKPTIRDKIAVAHPIIGSTIGLARRIALHFFADYFLSAFVDTKNMPYLKIPLGLCKGLFSTYLNMLPRN